MIYLIGILVLKIINPNTIVIIKENKNKWLLKVANKAITYTKTEKNINIFLFCTIASRILLNKFLDLIALCLQI